MSKSKPRVDFQYGGRLFFKNGSSYISAVNWDRSMKFGLLTDFDLLKALASTNTKPELLFSSRGRHLEKWKWPSYLWHQQIFKVYVQTKFCRIISIDGWDLTTSIFEKHTSAILEFYFLFWSRPLRLICMSFCITLLNFVQISNMADVCFSKTEVVKSQPSIEICRRNLVCT